MENNLQSHLRVLKRVYDLLYHGHVFVLQSHLRVLKQINFGREPVPTLSFNRTFGY